MFGIAGCLSDYALLIETLDRPKRADVSEGVSPSYKIIPLFLGKEEGDRGGAGFGTASERKRRTEEVRFFETGSGSQGIGERVIRHPVEP